MPKVLAFGSAAERPTCEPKHPSPRLTRPPMAFGPLETPSVEAVRAAVASHTIWIRAPGTCVGHLSRPVMCTRFSIFKSEFSAAAARVQAQTHRLGQKQNRAIAPSRTPLLNPDAGISWPSRQPRVKSSTRATRLPMTALALRPQLSIQVLERV